MKKTKSPLALVLSMSSVSNKDQSDSQSGSTTDSRVTMNGYSFAEAETMVRNFRNNRFSSHPRSTFWFSKRYIQNVCRIFNDEDLDGFRIYFAKKNNNNAIVIVATRKTTRPYPNNGTPPRSKFTHQDVFNFTSDYFRTADADVRGEIENDVAEARLHHISELESNRVTCSTISNAISSKVASEWVRAVKLEEIKTNSVWFPKILFEYWSNDLGGAPGGDGIRIYPAKKTDGTFTFVMTTTKNDAGKTGTDYYECYSNKVKRGDPVDNGEECPNLCEEVTW